MKVLVYETSDDRAKLIQDLLKSYRYKIVVNQKSANPATLREIQEIKPSLIIINTGVRAHLDLFEKIKQNARMSRIPIILISNFDSSEINDISYRYPNVECLVEPFKIKNFRHIVERWITFRSLYVN